MTEIKYVIARNFNGRPMYMVYTDLLVGVDYSHCPYDANKYSTPFGAKRAIKDLTLNVDQHYIKKITITVE